MSFSEEVQNVIKLLSSHDTACQKLGLSLEKSLKLDLNEFWTDLQEVYHFTEGKKRVSKSLLLSLFKKTEFSCQLNEKDLESKKICNSYYTNKYRLDIPKGFQWLGQLEVLEIIPLKNKFIFAQIIFPPEIQKLSSFKKLVIKSELEHLDASIQYCSALEILNLDYNGSGRIKSYWYPTLETLTEEIGRLKKLKILSLKYNKIKLLPRSIENLSNLEELYLEGNPLTALPENIGRLKKIKHLKIKSLSIKSLPESFSNLDSLESLELSDLYKLTAIPKSFGELKSLKKLLINYSGLSCLPKSFGQLQALEELRIESCKLSSLPNNFSKLSTLRYLSIHCNNLKSLCPNFHKLHQLEFLKLNYEGKRNFSVIAKCPNLEILDLRLGRATIIPKSFRGFKKLKKLDLSCPELKKMASTFFDFPKLEELYFSSGYNPYYPKFKLPQEIGNLTELKKLHLSIGNFDGILPDSIANLTKLVDVNLHRLGLQNLPHAVGNWTEIQSLNLSYNWLKTLPQNIKKWKKLKKLNYTK